MIILEHNCWPLYQIRLVQTQQSYTRCTNIPKIAYSSKLLPAPANIFTRTYLSYPWHLATLRLIEQFRTLKALHKLNQVKLLKYQTPAAVAYLRNFFFKWLIPQFQNFQLDDTFPGCKGFELVRLNSARPPPSPGICIGETICESGFKNSWCHRTCEIFVLTLH